MKLVLALFCLLLPRVALACGCDAPPPPAEALERAAAVFVGTVQQIKRAEQLNLEFVTLKVEQAWKGIGAGKQTVTVHASLNDCGYRFQAGKTYLVYAYGEAKHLAVSVCSRTRPVAEADEDLPVLNRAELKKEK